ncbi:DbpA RNA binding domain-containing protein [Tissierella sp. MB52-C2]|nr:DbpA RNA binding domain-containing protein [Tissierella sp. MB52-C2]WMM25085.1 DbpA RNA binding domain-containing protein [Tissierella sp. MB52-C2]
MSNNKLEGHEELDMVDFSSKPKSKGKGSGSSSMVRMHINIGKRKGVSPRHILSALLEVTGLPKKSVGDIDVYDKFTFIEVPREYEDEVLDGLNGSRIKGTRVKAEIANPKRK